MSPALKVLIVAEGPSEYGCLDRPAGQRRRDDAEGYFPPMLRKLLDRKLEIDAQKVMSIGRFDRKPRLDGHGDRAAKALAIAAALGYEVLVFVKDVDCETGVRRSPQERRRRLARMHSEIDAGFGAVGGSERVARVKATPCRMIEAWALGDARAIAKVRDKRARTVDVPSRPEDLWGEERVASSNHPKRARASARSRADRGDLRGASSRVRPVSAPTVVSRELRSLCRRGGGRTDGTPAWS